MIHQQSVWFRLLVFLLFACLNQISSEAAIRGILSDPFEAFEANPECPCIDSYEILQNYANCWIESTPSVNVTNDTANSSTKQPGILVNGACFPIQTYGSKVCSRHDIVADPSCSLNRPLGLRPAYCDNPFCFVDRDKCSQSKEQFYRSNLVSNSPYSSQSQPQLFYSYSTCNSTAEDWLKFSTINIFAETNRTLRVTLPAISATLHYKKDANGLVVSNSTGPEYYNDNHPWVGFAIDYFNEVLAISNIQQVQYTYRSRG